MHFLPSLPHRALALPAFFFLVMALPAYATVTGPYSPDANTLHLWHLDEAAGSGSAEDVGTVPLTLHNVGGAQGSQAFAGFGSSIAVDNELGGASISEDDDVQSNYQGADGAFTYEAMINLSTLDGPEGGIQNIFSRENEGGVEQRSFQFRIVSGQLHMEALGAGAPMVPIPTTGPHAFVAGEWFHTAVTYDGEGALEFYWTRVDDAFTEANNIGSAALTDIGGTNLGETAIGSQNRSSIRNELQGWVDEVRVSDVARSPIEFIFGIGGTGSLELSDYNFTTGIATGELVGTLSAPDGDPGDTFSYAFEAGDGDDDNPKFQINGGRLEAGSYDFTGDADGTEYRVRLSGTGAPSGESFSSRFILRATADTDRDGLPDTYELNPAWANTPADLSVLSDGGNDADMDGLSDVEEFDLGGAQFPGIDPTNPDSDGDDPGDGSLLDGAEIAGAGPRGVTDPLDPDSDGDGLADTVETNTRTFVDANDTGSDPNSDDTDEDGATDPIEVALGTDPNDPGSVPDALLTHHWKLDGDALDSVGTFDGTWAGDEAYAAAQPGLGMAADFDADGDAIATLAPAIASGSYTMSAWINPRSITGEFQYIAGVQVSAGAGGRFLRITSGGNIQSEFVGTDGVITAEGPAVPTGEWSHVAVTLGEFVDPGRPLTVYLNGEIVATATTTDADATTTFANFSIGARPDRNGQNLFDGLIDEVRVYAEALSSEQVAALAAGPSTEIRFLSIDRAPDGSEVTLTWTSRPDATYLVEFSSDLRIWLEIDDGKESGGETTTLTDSTFAPTFPLRGYYRATEN